jgi:hypothetical protein
MSVNFREEADGKIVAIALSGKLGKADYERFLPRVEQLVQRHGKIRMVIHMYDFHGWTMGALWEDLKFDVKHFSHIERLALVGEKAWEHGMAVFCKPFTTAKIRYFDRSQEAEAEAWIRADLALTHAPAAPAGAAAMPQNEAASVS